MTGLRTNPDAPRLSVVVPCFNEADGLPSLFAAFTAAAGSRTDLEVVFVNNGSTDGSAAIFEAELARPGRQFARLVTVPVNRGYGHGILAGLQTTRGEFIGWTHADSQYDPRIVLEGFARLTMAADPSHTVLQGCRRGRGLFDRAFTAGMTLTARILLGERVSDINAQPKLFPRTLLAAMENPPEDFSLDLYLLVLAQRKKFSVLRLPVHFGARRHGTAKGGGSWKLKWKLTKRTWQFMWRLRQQSNPAR